MRFYTMKMRPGTEGSDDAELIESFIRRKRSIAIGDGGDGIDTFNAVNVGDVVVVRAGQMHCLVRVAGRVSESIDISDFPDLGWLCYFCPIEVLSWWHEDGERLGIPRINFQGYLKTFSGAAERETEIREWYIKVMNDTLKTKMWSLLTANHQVVLTGAPGTGKTHLAREVSASMIDCEVSSLDNESRFGFVQFHPSYDYSDFVEGLKPQKSASGQVVFEVQAGVFKAFCAKAAADDPKNAYVFVIDEINRADLSRVFGELFFAIESGYRGKCVKTQYSYLTKDDKFSVPRNVYIIGTMNDVDRSVESMDFALRRRFAWLEIEADDSAFTRVTDNLGSLTDEARSRYKALNTAILATAGLKREYQIGPAYFRKLKDYVEKKDEYPFVTLWRNHLALLLREYLRGMPDADKLLEKLHAAYKTPVA